MAAGLETFAKVRALHDRTDNQGERAAAAGRMEVLARAAGMTVAEAMSKLDAPTLKPRNPFDDLFNTPEFRAHQAERAARYAERRNAALAEYGSEDAVWEPCEREVALEAACRPIITRKPIINGEMDTLQGWDGGRWNRLPPECQQIVANAFPAPASVREAWAEFRFWGKLADDRVAFCEYHDHDVRVRARTAFIEHLLDTMPARSLNDLQCRLDWMQEINDREWSRGNPEDGMLLATLRADIERMGARLRESEGFTSKSQNSCGVQNGHSTGPIKSGQCDYISGRDAVADVQNGQPEGIAETTIPLRRTNAEKRRDVLALLNAENAGISPLTDREIARRAGVSPQTVGNIRRSR